MPTKQEITKRIGELDAQAEAAAKAERRRQVAERKKLQDDCGAAGGHFYLSFSGGYTSSSCSICGYDSRTPAQTVGSNVLKG